MISQKELGQKIKDLREGLSLSQETAAKQVGLSRVAFSQIECGNRGMEALELAKIAGFFGVSMNEMLRDEQPALTKKPVKNSKQHTYKFNADKLKNVLLYILEKCGGKPNIGETVLYKLLYFIDFDSYEIYGKPVTGLQYMRLQYGPVPVAKEYSKVIKEMTENNELKIFTQEYFGRVQKRYVALKNYRVGSLGPEELSVIDTVINQLANMSATQIEGYAHGDIPWKITPEKQIIAYDLVVDREMPYAHNDYEKMWQDAAGSDVLKDLGPISKEEYDHYENLCLEKAK